MATNSIDTIFGFGEDALPNLYEISIVTYPQSLKELNPVNLASSGRVQNFNIEGNKVDSYDRHYKTQKILIPNGKLGLTKEMTFQLRVDREYKFYNMISLWANLANNADNPMSLGEAKDYLGEIIISRVGGDLLPIDKSKGINAGWKIHHCWVKSIGDIPFDWSNGEAITADVTIAYSYVEVLNFNVENKKEKASSIDIKLNPQSGGPIDAINR